MHRSAVSALAIVSLALVANACTQTIEQEEVASSTAQAYTGPVPTMVEAERPVGAPAGWEQPDSEGLFGQYGYCGATAAANLLQWYGRDVSPRRAIDDGCWSTIGTLPGALSAYFAAHHADLGCALHTATTSAQAHAALRGALEAGRPVILQFMTGGLNSHWVTAVGIAGSGDEERVLVMSWGGFYTLRWADLASAWRAAWGGPHPYLLCSEISPLASALRVEAQ